MPQVDVGGVKISYRDTGGNSMPVVLVHAFPLNGSMWDGQVEALSDRWRLLVPDLQGFGGSDAPDDPGRYSMDSFADSIAAVLDDAGAPRAVVVGLSMGGYAAFSLWRRHRDRVAALVLADTRAESDPEEGKAKRTAQQQQVREQGTQGLIDALVTALLAESTRDKKPDVVVATKKAMDNAPEGFIGALEAMKNRVDSTGDLTGITVPTLVIVGEHDAVTPPEAARKIHEHVGGSRLVVLPEAGHLSNLEAPDAFNGAVAEFMSEVTRT